MSNKATPKSAADVKDGNVNFPTPAKDIKDGNVATPKSKNVNDENGASAHDPSDKR